MCHLRDKYQRRAGWEYTPIQVSCRALPRGCYLLVLPRSPFRGFCEYELRFWGMAFSLVEVSISFSGASVPGWGGGLGCGLLSLVVVALTIRSLGRRDSPSPRSICSAEGPARWVLGTQVGLWRSYFGCLWVLALQELPSLFPIHTAMAVRCVVSRAATALWLLPRGRTSTGEVEAPTRDARGSVLIVALRVAETLAALALQRAFWSYARLHRHSQIA